MEAYSKDRETLRLKFNEDAENYDTYRPGYPDALYEEIIRYGHITERSRLLEIGIGTGKATGPFLDAGCAITAVELGNRLAAYVGDKYRSHKNFHVVEGDFISCPLETNFDLIYSATAFHWLPPEKAYPKVQGQLRDGGCLALFWNHPFPNRLDDATNQVNMRVYGKYRMLRKDAGREFSKQDTEKTAEELSAYGFSDIEVKLFHRKRTLTSREYIGLINTYSDHRSLPADTRHAFESEMKAALDEIGGKINIYDTIDLYLARK